MESRNGAAVDLKDKDELKEGSSVEAMQSMNWSIHLFARYTKSYAPAMPVVDTMKVEELAREKLKNYPGEILELRSTQKTNESLLKVHSCTDTEAPVLVRPKKRIVWHLTSSESFQG